MLLVTDRLSKFYGKFRALHNLTMSIAPGEVFGLLGPNGSGKSTALRLILGFLRPSLGCSTISGHNSWSDGVRARAKTAYLPGELRLYENMTGRQLIQFLGGLRGRPLRADLEEKARLFEINIDIPMATMSSGMKRKVALLLVLDPASELVIMDEPTNALDPTMREALLEEVRQAKQRGQAVFFSSHVLTEVEAVCDRVGILKEGQLAHLQCMKELRAGRRVHMRLGSDGHLPTLEGLSLVRRDHCHVHFEHVGELEPLMSWLAKLQVEELAMAPLGLDGIYRKIHGETA
ncbi:MAG: ABC transporter ATP-binding protein [Gemmataceae bacterium]|nr:ABC transporter ATP-binding protein [Gemmataceae bacterium]